MAWSDKGITLYIYDDTIQGNSDLSLTNTTEIEFGQCHTIDPPVNSTVQRRSQELTSNTDSVLSAEIITGKTFKVTGATAIKVGFLALAAFVGAQY